MTNKFTFDAIIIKPKNIDLEYSPIRKDLKVDTFVLGAFNPGMSKLSNGNIILMLRIAEALTEPFEGNKMHGIRWDVEKGYVQDAYNIEDLDMADPRIYTLSKYYPLQINVLTSLSWLLPIELSADGCEIIKIHYDKIISPSKSYQEYGIEDARISLIDGKYYMTACSVSSERQCTVLYISENGLDYSLEGIVLDHQNKDMILFEGLINHKFYALTRPLGSLYFATPPQGNFNPGPSINLAESPDALHWKPLDIPFIRLEKRNGNALKIGGGTPPILTPQGWLILFHAVEKKGKKEIYQTYWALLDKNEPWKIRKIDMQRSVLISNPDLTKELANSIYIDNIVFTTGIVDYGDVYIVASGELDLCTRITHLSKSIFKS